MNGWGSLVRVGAGLAVAGTVHSAVNARFLRQPVGLDLPESIPTISILVPARDEAAQIAGCLRCILAQDVRPATEVIVLDDGSSDGTGDIARAIVDAETGVRIICAEPLPDGWLGKPYACHQLAHAAAPGSEVLVFVDADVRLAPHAVRTAVAMLDRYDLDFVSPYPRQIAHGAAERIVQPLLQWSWLTFLPLRLAERSGHASLAVANGQFLTVRRDVYERAGGHAAVLDAVLDDLALARALRRHGARGGVADGAGMCECRMYHGWADLRDGYAKSLWAAFGSEPGAVAVLALLAAMYLVPAVAMARGSTAGAVGYLAGVAGRMLAARRSGGRVWPDPLAHPASVAVMGWLTARSIVSRRRGTLTWKGRPVEVTY